MDRLAELQQLYATEGWRSIKELAESLGVDKHPDGWGETIPTIVEAESELLVEVDEVEPAIEPSFEPEPIIEKVEEDDEPTLPQLPKPKNKYPTNRYLGLGMKVCSYCGDHYRSGLYGEPICSEGFDKTICPRLGG